MEVTDEMIEAYRTTGSHPAIIDPEKCRTRLAAVLAIVERDNKMRPCCPEELYPGMRCGEPGNDGHTEHKCVSPNGSIVRWN
jgi:hypothetical protein